MICRECGAYNPDHAEFCKVCAANLKGKAEPVEQAAPIEEEQPTKRFRPRPSWIPDAAEQPVEEAVESTEETAKKAEEAAQATEQVVEETAAVEEEPVAEEETEEVEEEAPVQRWSRSFARRSPAAVSAVQTEEGEEHVETDEETDGIYNDEEALEGEDDPFEYEPTPPKRRQQKKKNNTLFTVLLIAIIVVIVGILVLGGYMLLKNQLKCSGSSDRTNGNPAQSAAPASADPGSVDVTPTQAPATADSKTAVLQEYLDENNKDMIAIEVVVPANATWIVHLPHQEDYKFVNSESVDKTRRVKIQAEAFYPNAPLDEATLEFTPDVTIELADGSSYKVDCPSFTRTFPKLNISVTEPVPTDDEPVMAPESNIISVSGLIDEPSAEVSVNGVVTTIYVGGRFMYDYKFADDATEDTVDTIEIVAKKNNYVTDTKEIKVHAYKFVPEPMVLDVRTEGNVLRADKNGKLTVTGTTLPGAELNAVSDNTTNVLCGSVNVDGDGNFSFQITVEPTFYGMSNITLTAKKEGAEDGAASFTVLRGFADKESFVKYYNKTKTYFEIAPKKMQIADLLANQSQYATSNYGFRLTGSVVEVINIDGDMIVKMTINKTNETVYVHNLSSKWTPGENIGGKYNVYCNFTGTYEDTGCCEFIGWFAKKP